MKCPKIKKRLAIYVAIGFILIIISGPLLVTQDNLHLVDAIVVIGGDHKPDRVKRAVELYQQGYAPVVIISAGTQVLEGSVTLPEAIVMRNQALGLGLPEQVVVLEQESQSTLQNAIYTKAICQAQGIRSIILVTSVYHSRRARRIFQDIMGKDILLVVQPAPQIIVQYVGWFSPTKCMWCCMSTRIGCVTGLNVGSSETLRLTPVMGLLLAFSFGGITFIRGQVAFLSV